MTGGEGMEQVDEETVEHLESMLSRKVPINLLSAGRLMATGLFTRYQVASLMDYISTQGDVLSSSELALVDGFGNDEVARLLPFISFQTAAKAGRASRDSGPMDGEATVRSGFRRSAGDSGLSYASKLKLEGVGRFDLGLAAKSALSPGLRAPDAVSGVLAYHGRRYLNHLVVGDYHARFGQGLLMWSGFSLSGFSTAASFARHPGGLANAYTMNPSSAHRGMAAEFQFGRAVMSALYDLDGYGAANLTYYSKRGQLGMTMLSDASASMDSRWSIRRWDIFGEIARQASSQSFAEVLGVTFNPEYQRRVSLLVRNYPKAFDMPTASGPRSSTKTCDEQGAAIAADLGSWTISMDLAYHPSTAKSQAKALVRYAPTPFDWLSLNFKGTARYRPQDTHPLRTELRTDALVSFNSWRANSTFSICNCSSTSWLGSLEAGYVEDEGAGKYRRKLSLYLRATVFSVGSWDDRIYFYERDIPGSFSVPAYYGKGYTLSSVAECRLGRLRVGARASVVDYPAMRDTKTGKSELKLQASFIW